MSHFPTRAIQLDDNDIERLLDLLQEQRSGVEDGSISGFDQPVNFELSDIDALISTLKGN